MTNQEAVELLECTVLNCVNCNDSHRGCKDMDKRNEMVTKLTNAIKLWNLTSDRLPAEDEEVLITVKNDDTVRIGWRYMNQWNTHTSVYSNDSDIIAWMEKPLPMPYKEDTE